MKYIEFIGPPAVGKTTLLNILVSKRENDKIWRTYEEAVFDIVSSLQWHQLRNIKSKALYLTDKINFAGYKKLGICNTIINELTSNIPHDIQEKYEYLVESEFKALVSLDENISSLNKPTLLNTFQKAIEMLYNLEIFDYQTTVLFDKGPLKSHHRLNEIDPNQINPSTLPNAVIYCTASQEVNLMRAKKRMGLIGRVSKIYNQLNKRGLEYLVSYTHEIAEKNVEFIENIGLPIIKVDLTEPVESLTLQKLEGFITKYSEKTSSAHSKLIRSLEYY